MSTGRAGKGQLTDEQRAKLADLEANQGQAQPVQRADTTVQGGRYTTADGRVVDANGNELEGEK